MILLQRMLMILLLVFEAYVIIYMAREFIYEYYFNYYLSDKIKSHKLRIKMINNETINTECELQFRGFKDTVPTDLSDYEQGDEIVVGNKSYILLEDIVTSTKEFVEFSVVTEESKDKAIHNEK